MYAEPETGCPTRLFLPPQGMAPLCAVTNPFVTVPQLHSCCQEWVPDGAGKKASGGGSPDATVNKPGYCHQMTRHSLLCP